MTRFVIEHLPRAAATYIATPLDSDGAKRWLKQPGIVSLVRTTEMIAAIETGLEASLNQSSLPVALEPGDEALLITLSFGVLLASAQGEIVPLPEDWRCALLRVHRPSEQISPALQAAIAEPLDVEDPLAGERLVG